MKTIYRSPNGQRAVEQSYRNMLSESSLAFDHLTVDTRHGETFVLACGPKDAPPAVALHGGGTNSVIWFGDAAQWSTTRRMYLVDVLGEPGLSAPSRPALDSDAYAQWLDDVLDALSAERAAFVGASLGGFLAVDYAIRRPGRVERLALRAPGGIGKQKYGVTVLGLLLAPFGEWGQRITLRSVIGNPPDAEGILDYMLLIHQNYRPRRDRLPIFTDDQLRAITVPMHVTVGVKDRILDARDTARRLDTLVAHADVTVLPDAGHALTQDTAEIHRFLNEDRQS